MIFTDVVTNIPDAPQTYHLIRNSGEDVVKILAGHARKKGVVIKTSASIKKILKDGDRRVTGVTIDEDGKEARIDSKAVFVASGGFANNADWIKKHTGLDLNENLFPIGNTGRWEMESAWPATLVQLLKESELLKCYGRERNNPAK